MDQGGSHNGPPAMPPTGLGYEGRNQVVNGQMSMGESYEAPSMTPAAFNALLIAHGLGPSVRPQEYMFDDGSYDEYPRLWDLHEDIEPPRVADPAALMSSSSTYNNAVPQFDGFGFPANTSTSQTSHPIPAATKEPLKGYENTDAENRQEYYSHEGGSTPPVGSGKHRCKTGHNMISVAEHEMVQIRADYDILPVEAFKRVTGVRVKLVLCATVDGVQQHVPSKIVRLSNAELASLQQLRRDKGGDIPARIVRSVLAQSEWDEMNRLEDESFVAFRAQKVQREKRKIILAAASTAASEAEALSIAAALGINPE